MQTEIAKTYSQEEVVEIIEKSICQDREFLFQVIRALPRQMDIGVKQDWIGDPSRLQKFMAGFNPEPKPAPEPEVVVDDIIHMDRSVALIRPAWVEEPLYPEQEKKGPAEINIAKNCVQWLHNDQKDGNWTKGKVIHDYLVANGLIDSCYGLYELLSIQKKGVAFFRKHFKGKAVFAWKGVVRNRGGSLSVPCLYEVGDEVVLDWDWLGDDLYDDSPALRLTS